MKWFKVSLELSEKDIYKLKDASKIIGNDGLVIYPTDTVYGLGANPLSQPAVEKVFRIKRRPLNKPLPILVSNKDIILMFAEANEKILDLLERFWPGPITFILKLRNRDFFPSILTSNLDSIGVRMPNHPVTLRFIEYCGGLIVGTSANISGFPPPRNPVDAIKQLISVDAVIDAGPTPLGVPSTVIDVSGRRPKILRKGAVEIDISSLW